MSHGSRKRVDDGKIHVAVGSSTSADQTPTSGGGGFGSWLDSSAARLRRFSSPTCKAFLTPAFNACAANPTPAGSPDVDPSLLRYTRCRLPLSASSSSTSNSPEPHSTPRKHLHRLLHLRSPLSSLSSSSPLSPIENLPSVPAMSPTLYKTPVKVEEVEEDVLVMDGVLVSDSDSGRPRSSVSEFGSTGSSSSSSSASSGGGNGLYKTEICRSWEESGFCRYGSKCQYAHGKEELRCIRSMRQKSDIRSMRQKSESGGQSGKSCVHRNRSRYQPSSGSSLVSAVGWTTRTVFAPEAKATMVTAEMGSTAVAASIVSPGRSSSEPSFIWPPTEEEETCINQVLYGPSQRRRLPVFCEICPQ